VLAAPRWGVLAAPRWGVLAAWPDLAYGRLMCRSIKTLREPYTENVTDDDVRAAALQYVRKVSGFRTPARHNAEAFGQAVDAISDATRALLGQIEVRTPASAARAS
jgi:hypothetical protein